MSMAKIAAKSTDLDDQYRLTAYFLEDRRRPQAVLIRPIAGIESGNLTADYLSKITASQLSAQNEEQDSWENAMRNWDLEELQNRGIQIFLEMKNFPTEGELGWTQHIEDLQELVKEMDQIQKDKDKAWEQSMDPYAHLDWLPSKATIEQIKQKKISESNTLSFLVDARRFAAAYGILWSKEFGLGLTTSFNYWLKKLNEDPVQQRVATRYVARVRKESMTQTGRNHLKFLLGSNFPLERLNATKQKQASKKK